MADLRSNSQKACIHSDFITATSTKLTVRQKYWTWFKNTGRGFVITKDTGSLVFAVGTKTQGRYRTFEDDRGRPLFELERHWLHQNKAWKLTGEQGPILTAAYKWFNNGVSIDVSLESKEIDTPQSSIQVRAKSSWASDVEISSGENTLATMRCTNMMSSAFGSFKFTPPVWEVTVAPETDIALIAVLAVCVSDAFSENHPLML